MNTNKSFIFFLSAILALILLYYFLFNFTIERDFKPNYNYFNSVVQIDSLTKVGKSDTLNLNKFVTRVDSISKEISYIRNRYQEDVNLMIYKSTHWMEFWLGLFTIMVGFLGLFHYFKIRKFDNDFKTLKDEIKDNFKTLKDEIKDNFKTEKDNIENSLKSHKEKEEKELKSFVKGKFEDSDNKLKNLDENLNKLSETIKKSERENRISTLMMCISSFPDPAMFNSSPKRKQHIKFYLKKLHHEFNEYIKIIKTIKKNEMSEEEINRLSLALNSTKYVIIKTQSSFSSYHQNVTFNLLKNEINDILIYIVEKGNIPNDYIEHIDDILNKFNEIINNIEFGEGS